MHKLMIQKGFERLSQEEIEALQVQVEKRQKEEKKKFEDARELRGGFKHISQDKIETVKVQVEKRQKEEKKKLEDARELRDKRQRLEKGKKPIKSKAGEAPKQITSLKAADVQEQMLVVAPRKEVEAKMLLDGATEKVRTKPTGNGLLFPILLVAMFAGFVLVKKRKAKKVIHAT